MHANTLGPSLALATEEMLLALLGNTCTCSCSRYTEECSLAHSSRIICTSPIVFLASLAGKFHLWNLGDLIPFIHSFIQYRVYIFLENFVDSVLIRCSLLGLRNIDILTLALTLGTLSVVISLSVKKTKKDRAPIQHKRLGLILVWRIETRYLFLRL